MTDTLTGYVFDGWYTARNGGGSRFTYATVVTVNITVYAKWTILVSVHAALRPAWDPPLSNLSIFGNEEAQFSAGSGYASYAWYWNGAAIAGVALSDYTLAAYSKPPRIYELSVVVTCGGETVFGAMPGYD